MSLQMHSTRSSRRNRSNRCGDNSAQPHRVFTNNDLLTEILIRLPTLCIHLFTTVSKQWLQILSSPNFIESRRKVKNLDPPAGILVNHLTSLYNCDFISLDSRLKSKKNTMETFFRTNNIPYGEIEQVRIVQSCNGLLLCTALEWPSLYYVYNPSTKMYNSLPPAHYFSRRDDGFFSCGDYRLAFDPRKSIHYKVVLAHRVPADTWLHIYSSQTGNWTSCIDRFSYFRFDHFQSSIYWNDAFHWLEGLNQKIEHCKLNIENDEHPILTSMDIPNGLHRGRNFLGCFGGPCSDANFLLVKIPHVLHLQVMFFESRGSLLLASRHDIGSTDFTIYQMMRGSSVWSTRYIVNIRNFEGWSIRTHVWGICLGEIEEDAFVVINLSGKVVKYYPKTKTTIEIFDMEANQTDDDDDDDDDDDAVCYISPFEVDPNIYEFIPSLASV